MTQRMTAADIARQHNGKQVGDYYMISCPNPSHPDKNPSCKIWESKGGWVYAKCLKEGCCTEETLRAHLGLPIWKDKLPYTNGATAKSNGQKKPDMTLDDWLTKYNHVIEAEYIYRESFEHEPGWFKLVRAKGKKLRPFRWENGQWLLRLDGLPTEHKNLLYRLPELKAAPLTERIYIVEGEKDAEKLREFGLTATCNPWGSSAWRSEYAKHFKDYDVIVTGDNDLPGRRHRHAVVASVVRVAKSVRIVDLPGVPEGGDICDWLTLGNTIEEYLALARVAPEVVRPTLHLDDLTQQSIALVFADRYRNHLRYCHERGSWYRWSGTRWEKDSTAWGFWYASALCREVALAIGPEDKSYGSLNRKETAASVEKFAQCNNDEIEGGLAVVGSLYWDRDPWLMGTPRGVIDLKTGALLDPEPEQRITQCAATHPRDGEPTIWKQFLDDVTRGDAALIRFLQQVCGYCLTGATHEHVLFFVYGPGGNGKSVFLNTITAILGSYCKIAPMETFVSSRNDRHPTEIAMLQGARIVAATETEESREWAESRIKQLTGGDEISARFMRRDFFEFKPQFKLFFVGNHKPALRSVDNAARRRFRLIPFLFKPEVPDMHLEEKLKAEFPQILSWMIQGCLDWQANGLIIPDVVEDATEEYFQSQDLFTDWFGERVEKVHPDVFTAQKVLYADWKTYAESAGVPPGSEKQFGEKMGSKGHKPGKRQSKNIQKRGYHGVRLFADPDSEDASKRRKDLDDDFPQF